MQIALSYAAFLIVVLLMEGGILGDYWGLAVYGFLTAAVIYGVVAGRRLLRSAVAEPGAGVKADAYAFDSLGVQRALDRAYMMSGGRLPEDPHAKVAEIRNEILELLPYAGGFPTGSRDLFVLQRPATDYLSTSIEADLTLPQPFATAVVYAA